MSRRYTLGVVSVSFRDRAPEEIACAAADCGLCAIEWGSDVHARQTDKAALRRIAGLESETGVICSSYGTYFRIGADTDGKPTEAADIAPYLDAAAVLGTKTLRIWCGVKSSRDYNAAETRALLDTAEKSAALAADRGMTLCSEFHLGTFNDCVESARLLAEAGVGTYWQPFQTVSAEENLKTAAALGSAVHTVHVFNWSPEGRFPLSDAVDDWRRYLAVLPEARTLLLEFMPDDRLETLAAESEALRRIAEGE